MGLLKLKVLTRLIAGFGIVVLLTAALGAMALSSIGRIAGLVEDLYRHPFAVSVAVLEARADLMNYRRVMRELVTTAPGGIEAMASQLDALDADIDQQLSIVRERFLGSQKDVDDVVRAVDEWRAIRREAVDLMRGQNRPAAQALFDGRGARQADIVERELNDVIKFARNKALSFKDNADVQQEEATNRLVGAVAGLVLLGLAVALIITRSIVKPLGDLRDGMIALAAGDLAIEVPHREGTSEVAAMARAVQVFKEAATRLEEQRWLKTNLANLSTAIQAAETPEDFAREAIGALVPLTGGGVGVMFLWDEDAECFNLAGAYGYRQSKPGATSFRLAEGLVGQCALERRAIRLDSLPDDYIQIVSGTGAAPPRCLTAAPLLSKGWVPGVVEIASFQPFTVVQQAFLDEALPMLALNLEIHKRNRQTRVLLARTQEQAEELRASEEELRAQGDELQVANEELRLRGESLEQQTEELRVSEEELKLQSEELQASNEELTEKGRALEDRQAALEIARSDADQRALELQMASRYKSEFLANMSHELRTPLNSLLILAKSLADNDDGNLTADDIESAGVIYESGTHLLRLINDILDLSKVEAGKMDVQATDMPLAHFVSTMERRFRRLAEAKGLQFRVERAEDVPAVIRGDSGKIEQILNNLIGNAIKFTENGGVVVRLSRPAPHALPAALKPVAAQVLAVMVSDTGIGIPPDKTGRIFNAFEQVDGTTSRQYGGTGLGLSISLRLAQLMGGDIGVVSAFGQGSSFTLYLPIAAAPPAPAPILVEVFEPEDIVPSIRPALTPSALARPEPLAARAPTPTPAIDDDREHLAPHDETILIVEDDPKFARIVRDLSRKRGFKCLVAGDGRTGIDLACRYRPTGIILDIGLPELDGWSVMEQLKRNVQTRHIPVHFVSATEDSARGLGMGAVGYLTKPVDKAQIEGVFECLLKFANATTRRLLLVDDDVATRLAVTRMLSGAGMEIVEVGSGEAALPHLRAGGFDCMILDLGLPGIGGLELLDRATAQRLTLPPVVVYSARDLTSEETLKLTEYTDSIVIKGGRSPERLLDEVTLFLHSVQVKLPEEQQRQLRAAQDKDEGIAGRIVLVVDDDMRNAFALSKVLRTRGIKVVMAQDGQKALSQLAENPKVDIVLMDIMMPRMDGYETMRAIRAQSQFRDLPILALTAKAMVGDREKCLAAGANDYISKPVDIDKLMVMIRDWLNCPVSA